MFMRMGGNQLDEFRIELNARGDRTFVEIGDASAQFDIPFDREAVEAQISSSASERDVLVGLGSALFTALFSGPHGRLFWSRFSETQSQDRGLRLRITTNLERLQHLPWELLFDPSRGDFMSLSSRLAVVRTRPDGFAGDRPPGPEIRVLAAQAYGLSPDLQLWQRLAEEFRHVRLETLSNATSDNLPARLLLEHHDIFHFSGQGEVLPLISKRGGLRQALRMLPSGSAEPLMDRQHLGKLLSESRVRLAVLTAPHSDWIARSLAKYVPAAIGFRESVRGESFDAFCHSFYPALLSGTPLDVAVTMARQAIDRALPGTGEWCKLIFYMQQTTGEFLIRADSQPAAAAVPADKGTAKLVRLLEVYQRNLDALNRGSSAIGSQDPARVDAAAELQRKIADIRRQLSIN